ncbi:hypothetical protein WJX81_005068 [Elliptochloris bilobata]|uniref:UBC core domain-containing protein n=1 Tax=Elliptochloris bilobata TaxID=381761 RepID=A0AAW1RNS4_9CHLO
MQTSPKEASGVGKGAMAGPSSLAQASGVQRVMQEFKCLRKQANDSMLPQLSELTLHPPDNVFCWRFHLAEFGADVPGGAQLLADLQLCAARTGRTAALLLEATFPADYPDSLFFLRVVRPRCRYLTGHVTAGGSICIEALTLSGSANGWQRSFTVEGILQTVIFNMLNCESVFVRTLTAQAA